MARKRSRDQIQERLQALQEISAELMTTRHLRDTLALIVNKAVDLLVCDAGSVYLSQEPGSLTFEVAINRSTEFSFERHQVPIEGHGLASHVYRSGQSLRIRDVRRAPKSAPYRFDPSFDLKTGYQTRSVLIHPLRSSKGEILGVLQLINRKRSRSESWPSRNPKALAKMPSFDVDDARLLQSFAAVASSAIESSKLYRNIEKLFEGFVTASVSAIESRDPVTRGHSERVAILTVDLAEKLGRTHFANSNESLRFNSQQVAELRYAALLHDFGKIGVREATLQKEEKLTDVQKLRIRARFSDFKHATEIRLYRDYIQELMARQAVPSGFELNRIEKQMAEFGARIESYWSRVLDLNQPSVLNHDRSKALDELSHVHCKDCAGHVKPILNPDEIFSLKIQKGSLTQEERLEIESHVTHTFNFLRRIPWTKEFSQIPDIAFAHHERMDGSGYPRQLKDVKIPVQSKVMAICDVFDALAANDRPYKPALPTARALQILEVEAAAGKLDARILQVFIEARIFENTEFLKLQHPDRRAA